MNPEPTPCPTCHSLLARIERMADGYHFAGLLSEEATVREVLARLKGEA